MSILARDSKRSRRSPSSAFHLAPICLAISPKPILRWGGGRPFLDRSRRALGDCSVVACLEWSYVVLPEEDVLASSSSRMCLKNRL